ncbi:glycosyltransferase involved in cell wall biosynthesis [Mucilaginibacter yixingensis]|uniref:Glycosyltransferase involved in cell wall biosynthesis n=1 Tax=Mucilaginibacter yixingensis TaxID=1295612 RepID=A0A2T5J9B6_9SPHI|nr:glycosyltransferase family 4 protein [Mucilaginibacter yixingensis]PTQ96672.1 glycosyltransferase involved in cell wall biosynthesis [Mucilaginibacter yixingensis]
MQTKKKVLIACDSSKSLMDFRGKLIEEMAKTHNVSVFTPVINRQDVKARLAHLNVTVYENHLDGSNVSMLSDIRYIIQLFKLMRKVRPDVFFPYTFKPIIYGTMLAKLCGVKRITPMLTGLGYNFTPQRKKTLINRITAGLLRFSLKGHMRLRIIFQNRDDYLTLLKEKVLKGKHKIFIVNGSGVDLDHYQYTPADTNEPTFLMISRLINAKGILEYYEAAKILKARYPRVKFRLIGNYDKNIDSISQQLYEEIKHGEVIDFDGEVEDVRPFIKDSSVVVLPSYYGEGIPRSLLEAMAMGRAIITCNSVGCRETVSIDEKPNGFLVPVRNVTELASRMEYFITNPSSVSTYGLNSLALASKRFNVHLINRQMMKIMQLSA